MVPMTSLAFPNYQLGLEVCSVLRQMKIKHVRYGLFQANHRLLKFPLLQYFIPVYSVVQSLYSPQTDCFLSNWASFKNLSKRAFLISPFSRVTSNITLSNVSQIGLISSSFFFGRCFFRS